MASNSNIVSHIVDAMQNIEIEEPETGTLPPAQGEPRHVSFAPPVEEEKPHVAVPVADEIPGNSQPPKKMGRLAQWWTRRKDLKQEKAAKKLELKKPLSADDLEKLSIRMRDHKRRSWLEVVTGPYILTNELNKQAEAVPRSYTRPEKISTRGSHLLHVMCYNSDWEELVCKKNEEHIDLYFKKKSYVVRQAKKPTDQEILEMIGKIEVAGPNVILWLSCHGANNAGIQGISCGQETFLASEHLIRAVIESENLQGRKKVLVFDSCRNGGMTPNMSSFDLSETCVIFSAEDGSSAFMTHMGSLFPNVLISALNYLDEGFLQCMSDILLKYRRSTVSISIELGCRIAIVSRPEFFTSIKEDFFL